MNEISSIALFEQASLMLAKADTIQKAKELKDLAIVAGEWAKRKGMGEKAILYARSYALEAERRMGEILRETERATAGRPCLDKLISAAVVLINPTLSALGVTRKESSAAQQMAAMPRETFEAILSGRVTRQEAKREARASEIHAARQEVAEAGSKVALCDKWQAYHGDIATWDAPRQYDFIITDPPYPKEYLPLYETLAIRANEWLKDGGLLMAMCGQSYLNEIYAMMCKHLDYYWTAAYLTPGQPTPLRQVNVNTTWKPILILCKGHYTGKIFGDVFTSDGNDKEHHKWGQSVSGMYSMISKVCLPGQYILDPFCGAGTTLLAAQTHGCLADGLDLDIENVNITRGRLHDNTTD